MKTYKITLSPTADGRQQYLQVMSEDTVSMNFTLVGEFQLNDSRPIAPLPDREYVGEDDSECGHSPLTSCRRCEPDSSDDYDLMGHIIDGKCDTCGTIYD